MNQLTRISSSRLFNFTMYGIRTMASGPTRGDGSSISDGGSGGGGSVRAAGGKFAEREAALENEYFHKLQAQQLKKLKDHIHDEIKHHEEQIKRHVEAIERHKQRTKDLEKEQDKRE